MRFLESATVHDENNSGIKSQTSDFEITWSLSFFFWACIAFSRKSHAKLQNLSEEDVLLEPNAAMHDNACVNEVDATSAFANAFAQPTDTISYPIFFVEDADVTFET